MDRARLETFIDAADTLSFSDTASRRGLVQSAVSAQIKKLEEDVGTRLFERGRGLPMSLSADGAAFLVEARRIVALMEDSIAALDPGRRRDALRFGLPSTLAAGVLPEVLKGFAEAWPEVPFSVTCDRSPATFAAFERGELDAILVTDQGHRVDRVSVMQAELAWIAAPGFQMDAAAPLPLVFLADRRDLRRFALGALDRAGREGRIIYEAGDPIALRAFVQSGLAVSIVPKLSVTEPLVALEALPAPGRLPLAIYQRAGRPRAEVADFTRRVARVLEQPTA